MEGDLRLDEDLAGMVGSVVGSLNLSDCRKSIMRDAIQEIKEFKNPLISKFVMLGERTKYEIGFPTVSSRNVQGRGIEERGDGGRGEEGHVYGHLLPRKEVVRRRQMRARSRENLRAGVVYERETNIPENVYWREDVEAMLFPHLLPFGYGGFEWTFKIGVSSEEHVEKRLWSVNPLFRNSEIFIVFLFDISEKHEMHRSPGTTFIPDGVVRSEVEEFAFMCDGNAKGYKAVCRKDLSRGRRGLATASTQIGKPNVFQTETMNAKDMPELVTVSYRLFPEDALKVDDVSLATLYKKRQVVMLEQLLPATHRAGRSGIWINTIGDTVREIVQITRS